MQKKIILIKQQKYEMLNFKNYLFYHLMFKFANSQFYYYTLSLKTSNVFKKIEIKQDFQTYLIF